MEDKQVICRHLLAALQATRNQYDLIDLQYDKEADTVTAVYEGGKKVINVHMDSGFAMILDIMRGIR